MKENGLISTTLSINHANSLLIINDSLFCLSQGGQGVPGQNGSDGDLGMAGPRGDMVSLFTLQCMVLEKRRIITFLSDGLPQSQ